MAEFNKQSDAVDVTQIMERVREGIRRQRDRSDGDRQAGELAAATLERCLEPLRSGSALIEHDRGLVPPGRFDRDPEGGSLAPEAFEFNEDTVYVSSRGTMGKLIYLIRKLLNPILRLFFNPDPIILAMMRQAEINSRLLDLLDRVNAEFERTGKKFAAREEIDALNYEVVNNLVAEMTRLAVDMKNHRMLVESVAGRLDFDERRAQALESVRQARSTPPVGDPEGEGTASGPSRSRRRRRRGRRRAGSVAGANAEATGETPTGDGGAEAGPGGTPVEATEAAAAPEHGLDAPATPAESESPAGPPDSPGADDASPPPPAERTRPDPPPDDTGDR